MVNPFSATLRARFCVHTVHILVSHGFVLVRVSRRSFLFRSPSHLSHDRQSHQSDVRLCSHLVPPRLCSFGSGACVHHVQQLCRSDRPFSPWVEAVACLEGVDPTDAWGSPGFEPGRDSDRTGTPPTKTPVRPVGSRSLVLGPRPPGGSLGRTLGCVGFRKGGSEGYEPVLDRVRSPSPPSDSWKDTRDRIPTPVVGLDRPRLTSCLFRRGGSHGTHRTTRWTGPLDAFLHKPHPSIRFPFHSRFPRRLHRLPPL